MPSEVKMPQLGMNQDSAVIVSWLRRAGDKVASGEPIFEVETDKATMEVEAATDGYLAGLRVEEGADVPVGDVIAMIVETEEAVAEHATAAAPPPAASEASEAAERSDPEPVDDIDPDPEPEAPSAPVAPQPVLLQRATGKVLASPLAKRMAAERGIDLAALRAGGVPEPLHAADLSHASAGERSVLSANVDGGALTALLQRSENPDRTLLLAAFAAGAWRTMFDADDFSIAIRGVDGTTSIYSARPGGEGQALALSLIDLCDTRLSSFAPGSGGIFLAVAQRPGAYVLTLSFNEGMLPLAHAIALLDAIAARVEDPIRQLI